MSQRALIYGTGLVLLGMIILLSLNLASFFSLDPMEAAFIPQNQVRGVAIEQHNLLYTLNFEQQNQLISALNRSVRVWGVKPDKRVPAEIKKIIIYRFGGQPDLQLTPVAYIDYNLVFSSPEWVQKGYLMELSNGALQQMLSQAYDP